MEKFNADLLFKRILVVVKEDSYRSSNSKIEELKILEISPSGKWVKVQNQYGNKFWKSSSDITPVEVLPNLTKEKL
jgi:hypothetical protein